MVRFRFCSSSCVLRGWYIQDAEQRERDPSMWDHYLILDQVYPIEFYKAKVTERCDDPYRWGEYRIGASM